MPEATVTGQRGGARQGILRATRDLLEQPGAGGASLEAVAERAGYSRQAIYRHFGSRAGLLKAALAEIDERGGAEESVAEVLRAGDVGQVIGALIDWWSGYVAGFAGVARSVYAGRASDPALAEAWEDRMQALDEVCVAVVGRIERAGGLRAGLSPEVASELLWGLLSIPLWDQLRNDRGWSREQYSDRVAGLARAAIL